MVATHGEAGPPQFTLIWARPERATRGPAPSLRRDQIAQAAVDIADGEGLEAVSMRRVAGMLGVGAASLYRYVARKEELYDLMVDAVMGEDGSPPAVSGDWRSDVRLLAYRTRAVILRHPWMARLGGGLPAVGPHALAWSEYAMCALSDLGHDIDEVLLAGTMVESFVRGYVIQELAEKEAIRRSGITTEEWMRAVGPYMHDVLERGGHPWLARIIENAQTPHAADRNNRIFTTALEKILDGLAWGATSTRTHQGSA